MAVVSPLENWLSMNKVMCWFIPFHADGSGVVNFFLLKAPFTRRGSNMIRMQLKSGS